MHETESAGSSRLLQHKNCALSQTSEVARGLANDLNEAEEIVKKKRPRISIKKPQRELLNRWVKGRPQADETSRE